MAELNAARVVRRVRQKLQVSQEGLSRLLNATKGAVQHWERGRNRPDLARLLALRQLCPPSVERKELDALIRQTQAQVSPLSANGTEPYGAGRPSGRGASPSFAYPQKSSEKLRRENDRLGRQVAKLQAALERKTQQVRILEDLVKEMQREMAKGQEM